MSLNVVKCPDCRARIETSFQRGELVQCPSCDEVFRVDSTNLQASRGGVKETLARVAIPLGYVLFVGLPFAGVMYWLSTQDGAKPREQPAEPDVAAAPLAPLAVVPKKAPVNPFPRETRPRPDPAGPASGVEPGPPEPPEPTEPEPAKNAKPATPPPLPEPVEVAPEPREVVVIDEAPEPREVLWRFPTTGWESKWQTLGAVDLRLAHVGVARYPVRMSKGDVVESTAPALVVVVEARLNDPTKERSLLAWTYGVAHYKTLFVGGSNKEVPSRQLPSGARLNHGLVFPVPLPKDRSTVRDVLLFEVPPAGTQGLELRLEGERVREVKDATFEIPEEGWRPAK